MEKSLDNAFKYLVVTIKGPQINFVPKCPGPGVIFRSLPEVIFLEKEMFLRIQKYTENQILC